MASENTRKFNRNVKPADASAVDNTKDAVSQGAIADKTADTWGLEASELPDKGRGPIETDFGKEVSRQLPQDHGGELGAEGGLRADRAFGGHRAKGVRGKN